MSVVVIVPYAPLCEARTRAMQWNVKRWTWLLPSAEVIIALDDLGVERAPGSFNKPRAVNRGLARAKSKPSVVVVADCDTTTDASIVERVRLAQDGVWTCPGMYRRLDELQTEYVLSWGWLSPPLVETEDQEHTQGSWSGVVVMPAAALDAIGGRFDERFDGWSADDVALAFALETLYAPVTRLGTVWHLHHPRSLDDTYGRPGYEHARSLTEAYMAAHGDPDRMRAVIDAA